MGYLEKAHRAWVSPIKVKEADLVKKEREDTIQKLMQKDTKVYKDALHAIENGDTTKAKSLIDKALGDEEMYVKVAITDFIGPGFCNCDCNCEG